MYIAKYLKANKLNSLYFAWKYDQIFIICSSRLTVFLELHSRETVCILKQIMFVEEYPYKCLVPNRGYCWYSLKVIAWNLRVYVSPSWCRSKTKWVKRAVDFLKTLVMNTLSLVQTYPTQLRSWLCWINS